MKVLVTGASGFVGSAVVARLAADGDAVIAVGARGAADAGAPIQAVPRLDLRDSAGWQEHLAGAHAVVHAAARVHRLNDPVAGPLQAYRAVNVDGTMMLARTAVAAGVRRFVFLSSIKVNGETTAGRGPFRADETPAPVDHYGISKREAEQALFELAEATGLEVVVIRPPLVYGPGVKANFRAMLKLADKGWPLPLGAATARRSLVALDNLVDLVVQCLRSPAAAGQTFLASDGEDLGVAEMLRRLAQALDRPARLVPVPAGLLRLAATLTGRRTLATRLLAPLQVDIEPTRRILGWNPPVAVDQAMRRVAAAYRAETRS